MSSQSPEYSPFFAVMGASAAMVFSGKYTSLFYVFFLVICLFNFIHFKKPFRETVNLCLGRDGSYFASFANVAVLAVIHLVLQVKIL